MNADALGRRSVSLLQRFLRRRISSMEFSWRAMARNNNDFINELKRYGIITSLRVEKAMRTVDRGAYSASLSDAYMDRPHPIGHGQTISAPHMHAYCLESLQELLVPGARVLDVGSGSGYLTACFGEMVNDETNPGQVLGIEIVPELVRLAKDNIARGNPELSNVRFVEGNAWKIIENERPFNAIHVGAAAESLPDALVEKLAVNGRMIIPLGTSDQALWMIRKNAQGKLEKEPLMGVMYVPLVKSREKR